MRRPPDSKFGKRLQDLREKRGLTQITAAEQIGVGYKSLQSHEAGYLPNQNNLNKYIEFYGCNKGWLLTGEGHPIWTKEEYLEQRKVLADANENEVEAQKNRQLPVINDKSMSVDIKKTIDILESDTIYRTALRSNIHAFHTALNTEKEIGKLKTANQTQNVRIIARRDPNR